MSGKIDYWIFAGPQERARALQTLLGIMEGIALDRVINIRESEALLHWMGTTRQIAGRDGVLKNLLDLIDRAFADGVLTPDEIEDIVSLAERSGDGSPFYDALTRTIQELHGIMAGVAADDRINETELRRLADWLEEADPFQRYWPITEARTAVMRTLADGKIDSAEHARLLEFFIAHGPAKDGIGPERLTMLVGGVCAVDPKVTLEGHSFCFTGGSTRCAREELFELVQQAGGTVSRQVTLDLDYLVVCEQPNDCWVFQCYGRKVERAIDYRRRGQPLVITHERDFWDAVENLRAGVKN